jgi:inosose dehydratase
MSDWKLAYQANCWGNLGGNAEGVTSIAQLSYRTFGDMDRACAEIAAAGYTGVELFDGNLLDYGVTDFRALLKNNGLSLVAAYSGANFIFDDILPEPRIWSSVEALSVLMEYAKLTMTSWEPHLTA